MLVDCRWIDLIAFSFRVCLPLQGKGAWLRIPLSGRVLCVGLKNLRLRKGKMSLKPCNLDLLTSYLLSNHLQRTDWTICNIIRFKLRNIGWPTGFANLLPTTAVFDTSSRRRLVYTLPSTLLPLGDPEEHWSLCPNLNQSPNSLCE